MKTNKSIVQAALNSNVSRGNVLLNLQLSTQLNKPLFYISILIYIKTIIENKYNSNFPEMSTYQMGNSSQSRLTRTIPDFLAPVVQTLDSAIHRINHYPEDKYYGNKLRCPLDSDLSSG